MSLNKLHHKEMFEIVVRLHTSLVKMIIGMSFKHIT